MDKTKLAKKLVFAAMIFLADFMLVESGADSDLIAIYDGVRYGDILYYYMLQFFVFSCYSVYIQGEFENLVSNSGIYIMIRGERKKLFSMLNARLIKILLNISFLHLAGYVAMELLLTHRVHTGDGKAFLHALLVNFLVYYLLLFVQMILELWFTGRIALCVIMFFYLFSLFVGDLLLGMGRFSRGIVSVSLQFIFFPNIAMRLRWKELLEIQPMNGQEFIILAGMIVVAVICGYKLFQKKDIF